MHLGANGWRDSVLILLKQAIREAAKELRDTPVTADLLVRARNPALEAVAKSRRENGFWMGYVDEAQSKADRLERIRQQRGLLEAITASDLQKLAKTYLTEEAMQRVRIVSDKAPSLVAASAAN